MASHPHFQEFFKCLNHHGVEYVIVGGYAMAHHGRPRYTKDMDVLVSTARSNTEKLIDALDMFGFSFPNLTAADFQEAGAFVRLGREPQQIDILTETPGLEWQTVWERRSPGVFGDVPVHFISREDFIATKRASGRPRDLADVDDLNLGEES